MATKKVQLPGSERQPIGTKVGEIPPDEMIEISVILKPMARAAVPPAGGASMSRQEFAAKHGADPSTIAKVQAFAKEYGLTVSETAAERRTVKLEGTFDNMRRAFGVQMERYSHEGQAYRARTGSIQVPQDMAASLEAVLGLDDRPQAKPHFRVLGELSNGKVSGAKSKRLRPQPPARVLCRNEVGLHPAT